MDICVLVRGEISNKAFQVWVTQVPKKFVGCTISPSFRPNATCVVGKSTSEDVLLAWTKGVRPDNNTVFVSPEWIISSLKNGKLLDSADFTLSILSDTLETQELPVTSGSAIFSASNSQSSHLESKPGSLIERTSSSAESSSQPFVLTGTESRDADVANANAHITTILDELQAMYLQMGDQFRAINYKKCSSFLKRLPRVDDISALDGIQGFGKSLKTTIHEILTTGSLRKLQHLKKNPRSVAITTLSEIWGVGEKTAEQLYNQGYQTIADLRTRGKHLLNRQQLIGLKHYEEFLIKIPRAEVDEICEIVKEECHQIDPEAECTVCGSYRRGKSECGDVDILITPMEGRNELPAHTLSQLIEALTRRGFLTDHLSLPTGHREYVETSALQAIQRVHSEIDPSRRLGSVTGSVRSGSKGSVRGGGGSVRGSVKGSERNTANSQSQSQSQFSQLSPLTQSQLSQSQSQFYSPSKFPTQRDDSDVDEGSIASQSDFEGSDEDIGSLHDDVSGDEGNLTEGEGGAGTQSETELANTPSKAKYDTYGGKKVKSEHRLYFGSRGSYMGVCKVPHPGALHRRIDIKVYPRHQKAFALFYFTGSDAFNRGVRFYAARNSLALDDKGLMKCVRDSAYKIVTRGELIPCATEHDIFDVMGLAYREPWERPLFDRKSMIIRPIAEAIKGNSHNRIQRGATRNGNNDISNGQPLSPDKSVQQKEQSKSDEVSVLGKRPGHEED
eukprot:gene13614-15664_t